MDVCLSEKVHRNSKFYPDESFFLDALKPNSSSVRLSVSGTRRVWCAGVCTAVHTGLDRSEQHEPRSVSTPKCPCQ